MPETIFSSADILLPKRYLNQWAVIACDQFTSQPEYWEEVDRLTADCPSAARIVLPEARLHQASDLSIRQIHETMLRYLHGGIFQRFPDAFIYTERKLNNGGIRRGLIGKIDLDSYDYSGEKDSAVRATEKTVTERIPPRMAVRRGAAIELPHILLFCDDDRKQIIEPLAERKAVLPVLYDFDLMLGGGHVSGWLITGEEKENLTFRIREYEEYERRKHPGKALLYAVGDGNHSLATAKACYEEMKAENGAPVSARYSLCELNNIHDDDLHFAPIHRIVKGCDPHALINAAEKALSLPTGGEIPWQSGDNSGLLRVPVENGMLPLAVLQDFLDGWLRRNAGELDYIHGEEALSDMAKADDSVGFRLPVIGKEELFPAILAGGVLPRKAFSVGEAKEKRYYLEARQIL
ncbi:MAG: DUF1015 domain-containing protein [Oscillospiraceae bacterium]|nr:DUF1015 domain-containing protein [Oscillospiraceae bacterium]